MSPSRIVAAVVVLASMMLASDAVADTIVLRTQFPVQGEATPVLVQSEDGTPIAGAAVTATYRPGSNVEKVVEIGSTSSDGLVTWSPDHAGIATLTAEWSAEDGEALTATENVSVKFSSTPLGGVAIMIFAGLLLVGSSLVRITRVLKAAA